MKLNITTITMRYRYCIFLLLLLPILFYPTHIYDEGIILVNAKRILNGELPYKDFWTIYSPGQFYLYAFYQYISTNIFFLRIMEWCFGAVLIIQVDKVIARNTAEPVLAFALSLLVIVFLLRPELRFYPPIYTALLLGLMISYYWSKLMIEDKNKYAYIIIFLQLVLLFFRQDLFVYSLLSLFVAGVISGIKGKNVYPKFKKPLGVFIFLLGLIGLTLHLNGFSPLILEQLFLQPLRIIPEYRSIPVGYPYYIISVLYILVFMVILYRVKTQNYFNVLYIATLGLLLNKQMFNRADMIHAMPVAIVLVILAASLISRSRSYSNSKYKNFLLIFILIVVGIKNITILIPQIKTLANKGYSKVIFSEEQKQVLDYLKSRVKPQDYIYMGVGNHDKFIISDVLSYFLINAKTPTQYTELHPGITNTLNVQNEIKSQLLKTRAKYIILYNDYYEEDNKTKEDARLDILDNYIKKNYTIVLENPVYTILEIKPL